MCEKCGCAASTSAGPPAGGGHAHFHGHGHPHGAGRLSEDDLYAERNRGYLLAKRVLGVNLVSCPGSNTGALVARTAAGFAGRRVVCVVTGALLDRIAPHEHEHGHEHEHEPGGSAEPHGHTHDAHPPTETAGDDLAAHGPRRPVDAHRLWHALARIDLDTADMLIVENCGITETQPARDLGETARVALLSSREGESAIRECPALFAGAHVVLIDQSDRAPGTGLDLDKTRAHLAEVAPAATVFPVSPETGEGMQAWLDFLEEGIRRARGGS